MIVAMVYRENTHGAMCREAELEKFAAGWCVTRLVISDSGVDNVMHEPVVGLDRREAQQMARRWVETGER